MKVQIHIFDTIKYSFLIFYKHLLKTFFAWSICFILSFVSSLLWFIPGILSLTKSNLFTGWSSIFLSIWFLLSLCFSIILIFGLWAGFLRFCLKLHDFGTSSLKLLFKNFKIIQLLRLIGANILIILLVFGGIILFVIPGLYIAARLILVNYLIIDKNMRIINAMKNSIRLTKNNVLVLLMITSIYLLINQIIFGLFNFISVDYSVKGLLFLFIKIYNPLSFFAFAKIYRQLSWRI
ncbi:hypothetical protein GF322_01080 [Candidatus Dependentiae bacterium]|nr:hypothetical protein [Candidatus Dependentiae bacterium]